MLKKVRVIASVKGFTLIELVVVIVLLGILFVIALSSINPKLQLDRAYDVRRKENLSAFRNSLDSYYSDNHNYPYCITEQEGLTNSYIQKIPSDPACENGQSCYNYLYVTDPQNPQWFVLFAKLSTSFGGASCAFTCPMLPNTSFCQYQEVSSSEYNYCITGGFVDTTICPYVVDVTPTPLIQPIPTFTSTPTLTSPALPGCAGGFYYCSCGLSGVKVYNATFAESPDFVY